MKITIQRTKEDPDSTFGTLSLDWNPFMCITLENTKDRLKAGVWPLTFAYSPHFNRQMPLINVPGRTWTWIHWANFFYQLLGCVAVGSTIDGEAIDSSVATWNALMALIEGKTGVTVEILDIPITIT